MNQWDELAGYFNTHADEIDPGAADNILLAWPALLRGIEQAQKNGNGLSALDFGCGTGAFCAELLKIGYRVSGYDSSEKMIVIAKANVRNVSFFSGETLPATLAEEYFDLLTAIMVFQFIERIEETLARLAHMIMKSPQGVLAFAVFNPDYVKGNHGEGKLFQQFENPQHPTNGFMCPAGVRIPVFIRGESEYDTYLDKVGMKRIHMEKPPFTKEFLDKYPTGTDTSEPEYLVLAYSAML